MITNISDRKDTKFLSYNNTLSVEIKFHWQIIAFFLLYRWHSYINNVVALHLFQIEVVATPRTDAALAFVGFAFLFLVECTE